MKAYFFKKHLFATIVCGLAVLVAIPTTVMANGRGGRGGQQHQQRAWGGQQQQRWGGQNRPQQTAWRQNHPRRTEVNNRLGNQNRRIRQERKEGEISGGQARQMHQQDHQIRSEERQMAGQNGGHITRQEQGALNQQENQVSKEIGR